MIHRIIDGISSIDNTYFSDIKNRFDGLAKPLGSLGYFEDIAAHIGAINCTSDPKIDKGCVIVMCADNGVVQSGVSITPQYVTIRQAVNITKGTTGLGTLSKFYSVDNIVVDVGINGSVNYDKIINRRIRNGTDNILYGPAMNIEDVSGAIGVGIELAKFAGESGYHVVGVGEMGIGNTTTSAAVLSAILGLKNDEIDSVIGMGGGLTTEAYKHKINVVKGALAVNNPYGDDIFNILSKVGGLDIAAMAGVFIGCSYYKIPVVIDGFISAVAALCAYNMNNKAQEYMFTSHFSVERGYKYAIDALGLNAYLNLGMRLGEGSGCPIMINLMRAACFFLGNMATFEDAEIDNKYLDELKGLGINNE